MSDSDIYAAPEADLSQADSSARIGGNVDDAVVGARNVDGIR